MDAPRSCCPSESIRLGRSCRQSIFSPVTSFQDSVSSCQQGNRFLGGFWRENRGHARRQPCPLCQGTASDAQIDRIQSGTCASAYRCNPGKDNSRPSIKRRNFPEFAAVLGTLRHLGLHDLLSRTRCPERDLICALITARILDPRSKLATARGLDERSEE